MPSGIIASILRVAVLVLLVVAAIALAIALWPRGRDYSTLARCRAQLRSLWQLQSINRDTYGGPSRLFPRETGSRFWLVLARTPKPLVDRIEIYFCPLAGNEPVPDRTDYRGPARDVNGCADGDPVGADRNRPENNHGPGEGGSVLLKSGSIQAYEESDPVWIDADSKTGE